MPNFMEVKKQIKELETTLEELRKQELQGEVDDIKERIAAYGITPEMLFPASDIRAARAPHVKQRAKYQYNGKEWSGRGAEPKWFKDALAAGVKREDLVIRR